MIASASSGVTDLLTEDVDRRRLPLGVQPCDGLDSVLELLAGDVAVGDPPDDRPRNGREQADERAVEDGQARGL